MITDLAKSSMVLVIILKVFSDEKNSIVIFLRNHFENVLEMCSEALQCTLHATSKIKR